MIVSLLRRAARDVSREGVILETAAAIALAWAFVEAVTTIFETLASFATLRVQSDAAIDRFELDIPFSAVVGGHLLQYGEALQDVVTFALVFLAVLVVAQRRPLERGL